MVFILRIGRHCGWRFRFSWPLFALHLGVIALVVGADWAVGLYLER